MGRSLRYILLFVAAMASVASAPNIAFASVARQISSAVLEARLELREAATQLKLADPESDCLKYSLKSRLDIVTARPCSTAITGNGSAFGKNISNLRYGVPRPTNDGKASYLEISYGISASADEVISMFAKSLRMAKCQKNRYNCQYLAPGNILITIDVTYESHANVNVRQYSAVRVNYINPDWKYTPAASDCC